MAKINLNLKIINVTYAAGGIFPVKAVAVGLTKVFLLEVVVAKMLVVLRWLNVVGKWTVEK